MTLRLQALARLDHTEHRQGAGLSFSAELLDSWLLPWVPRVLRETDEGISGGSGSFFFRASRDSGNVHSQFVATDGLPRLLGSHVIVDNRSGSCVLDLDGFEGRKVELPKPRTAAYVANRRLVMETAMTRHTF